MVAYGVSMPMLRYIQTSVYFAFFGSTFAAPSCHISESKRTSAGGSLTEKSVLTLLGFVFNEVNYDLKTSTN